MYSSVLSGVLYGLKAEIVRVEVDVGNGIPSFEMSGFLSNEVKEARERVRVAIRNSGYELPPQRIVVNISPADIRKCGTGFDLPIALAILSANGYIDEVNVDNMIILGELSLDGSINGVSGVLPCVCEAKKSGISKALIPVSNYNEGRIVEKVNIIPTNSLKMAVQYINNGIIENQRQDNPEQCRTIDKQEINKEFLDLMIVPLVGYDTNCYRLGYGGGYYDRYLKDFNAPTIGLAYSFQYIEHYQSEDFDIPLDDIITDKKI